MRSRYLAALVVKDAGDADGHQLGAGSTQRPPTQGEDKGHVLLLAHGQDVVQSFVKAPCTGGAHAVIKAHGNKR